jgi:hypothetical protein
MEGLAMAVEMVCEELPRMPDILEKAANVGSGQGQVGDVGSQHSQNGY